MIPAQLKVAAMTHLSPVEPVIPHVIEQPSALRVVYDEERQPSQCVSAIVLDVECVRCPDCPSKFAMLLLFMPGVQRVMVEFDAREASVTIDSPININSEMLIVAIARSGVSAALCDNN